MKYRFFFQKYLIILALGVPICQAQEQSIPRNVPSDDDLTVQKGKGGSGGGNAISDRIIILKQNIGINGATIRPVLVNFLNAISLFKPRGKIAKFLIENKDALIEDIQGTAGAPGAPYQLKKVCPKIDDREMDFVTEKGVKKAPICIGALSLARENAIDYSSLAGGLMHEHVRHLGEEDTDDLAIHPVAEFVRLRVQMDIGRFVFGNRIVARIPDLVLTRLADFTLTTTAPRTEDLIMTINKMTGRCDSIKTGYTVFMPNDTNLHAFVGMEINLSTTGSVISFTSVDSESCNLELSVSTSEGHLALPEISVSSGFGNSGRIHIERIHLTEDPPVYELK